MEKKSSEIIADFLDLVEKSHMEYEDAKNKVELYNSKTYDWTHDLEDANGKSERNKIATAWQKELRQRRVEKDRMKLFEEIHEFGRDVANKACLKRLKRLLEDQKRQESYVDTPSSEREFKRRAVNKNDSDN